MKYIHLSNDSYVLYLSIGLRTFGRTSFNFNKIKKLVEEGAPEEEIISLTKIPDLPNGTYEAYLNKNDQVIYLHTPNTGVQVLKNLINGGSLGIGMLESDKNQFLGIYASLDDVIEDWPEFLF